jgi:nitrogen regulatory protein P-II 2
MSFMKLITAIVRPHKLEELRLAVAQLGVQGMTVTEVIEGIHGARSKLEIAVAEGVFEPVMEAIANVARTGRGGDGHITVCELLEAVRIRTSESGEAAT